MKTGGDFRDHLVDLTDGGSRPGEATEKHPQRRSTPGRMRLEKWLHSSMKIEMTDGRTLVGSFVCTDRDNNIILGSCTEHLRPDGKSSNHAVLCVASVATYVALTFEPVVGRNLLLRCYSGTLG
ncbi:N-alpha-acetyltransferase 38, NatC auxiliary subunit [Chionoecetes opilio]|uniref:N-alpha-acetyltransferase 38, NatC auxiliary subunit n=1 Tax=Chionoecetes opilio TaxID=41210 RepID=A0A8J4Z3L7_CHIOP|nr:N-alpha-acetyltransferase 38, NatC auxiliary subunit [Chionoecetes opilio]